MGSLPKEDCLSDVDFTDSYAKQDKTNRHDGGRSCNLANHDYNFTHDTYLLLENDAVPVSAIAASIFQKRQQGLNAYIYVSAPVCVAPVAGCPGFTAYRLESVLQRFFLKRERSLVLDVVWQVPGTQFIVFRRWEFIVNHTSDMILRNH